MGFANRTRGRETVVPGGRPPTRFCGKTGMRALEADPKQTVGGAARRARARAVAVVLYVAAVCAFAASGVAQQAPPAPLAQTASPATTAQEMPPVEAPRPPQQRGPVEDRKSTRLNSSHPSI